MNMRDNRIYNKESQKKRNALKIYKSNKYNSIPYVTNLV